MVTKEGTRLTLTEIQDVLSRFTGFDEEHFERIHLLSGHGIDNNKKGSFQQVLLDEMTVFLTIYRDNLAKVDLISGNHRYPLSPDEKANAGLIMARVAAEDYDIDLTETGTRKYFGGFIGKQKSYHFISSPAPDTYEEKMDAVKQSQDRLQHFKILQ